MAMGINNVVGGNVVNDYGLDNVPYTISQTGPTTCLLAFIGWDVAPQSYQSSGKSPAVNVTDSAGNLWRQIGISTVSTQSRGSIWIADNPRQTKWVSVAVTGWAYSTSYMVAELDSAPTSMGAIQIDFVQTVNSTVPATTLTVPGSATTTDLVFGLVTCGGASGALTVPTGWTGVGSFGGAAPSAATTYGLWCATAVTGPIPAFTPTWATAEPYSGIVVGINQSATAPTQSNPNMPNVVVEAAFGATPGDYTQSVDYTWDNTGLTWTDISSRCFSKGEGQIKVKRGRQYELSQEETGEIEILLDNHDGAFTYGNLLSPYYSTAINQNMSFQSTTAPWVLGNATSLTLVSTPVFASGYAGFITPAFSAQIVCSAAATPQITSEMVPIDPGYQYSVSGWCYAAAGWASGAAMGINWYTAGKVFISSTSRNNTVVPAATWTQASNPNLTPPANAAFATFIIELNGTPGSGFTFNVAEMALSPGTSLVRTGCLIPTVPIRITAWYGGVQYPIGFGYVEKWPQAWPEMPQWGFATVTAVDALGPMSSTQLPSAVEGDVRKDFPFAYFPTGEQYEFTSQSLTPTASPLDANGLISVNDAFGNNRYGAYRDGWDQPVTTGQALNLLGDENTCLGATTYGGQEVETNGPGMFYFDPNIPTNANGAGFSAEFWFVWGNSNSFSCELFSAFGRPSSFYAVAPETTPTNGGVIAVGINTGLPQPGTIASGFYCNGVELTGGQFNQTTFEPQHFVLTTGPNGTTTYLNGSPTTSNPSMGTIPQIRAFALGPARFSYDVSDMVVYNGYNYVAGHVAWYGEELTPTQIANHYESGVTGWVGVPASGRFAQALTWGGLGLKRGGTAWFTTYGQPEGTYMSEAYGYQGSSASDIMNQIVQTEGGRCYTQANGSIIYTYRWTNYNQGTVATFGDNGTTQLPFEQGTSFAADNQFIYNQVTATQTRGPNQDFYVFQTNSQSQTDYFLRSGLDFQSYAMLPFDVFDVVNWGIVKYKQPIERVVSLSIDASKTTAKFAQVFPVILGLELNQTVFVTRNPVGGGAIALSGNVQSLSHDIGATYWKSDYEVTPNFPDNNVMFTDTAGYNSPNNNYLAW